jgi:hypothetical protein
MQNLAYEALLGEILALETARDSLPPNSEIAALFGFTIARLAELVDAILWSGSSLGKWAPAPPLVHSHPRWRPEL